MRLLQDIILELSLMLSCASALGRQVQKENSSLMQRTLLFKLIGRFTSTSVMEGLVEANFLVMINKTISYSFRETELALRTFEMLVREILNIYLDD